MRPRRRLRLWARSVAFTMALSLLVALAVGWQKAALGSAIMAVGAVGLGLLYLLFPRGLHFAFGTATGLALYATLFVVLSEAQFPQAPVWAQTGAFLLPVLAFLAMVYLRRAELAGLAEVDEAGRADHLLRASRWLLPAMLVGVLCFLLPLNRLDPAPQGLALLLAMTVIAAMPALAVRDVVALLVDVALIIEELAARIRHVVVPAVAFLLLYALLVIAFGAFYRIADGLSAMPLFHGPDGPLRVSFPDALHFSVVTFSTVGYGDIRPHDDGIRVLASIQVITGQLLLLFGFAEIMRSRRSGAEVRDPTGHGPAG